MNQQWSPMLLTQKSEPFNSKDYLFEIKFDGIRCFAYLEKDKTILVNKRFKDVSKVYPELSNLHNYVKQSCLLDGELVYIGKDNKPNFSILQSRSIVTNPFKIKQLMQQFPIKFIAYDILIVDEKEIIDLPLLRRKKLLSKIVKKNDWLEVSNFVLEFGIQLFNLVKKEHLEGVVAKKLDSLYYPNTRTKNWIKIKDLKEQDFVADGLIFDKLNLKYILLAEKQNTKWEYRGKVYCPNPNDKDFLKNFANKHKTRALFKTDYDNVVWLNPTIKITVSYMMLTHRGHMRSPIYRGIVSTKQ